MTETLIDPSTTLQTGILQCDPTAYHADPCTVPSLSASLAIKLVQECPVKAWEAHPRLGNQKMKPNRAMQFGSVCHQRFTGVDTDIVVIDAPDYRTKAAQRERDEAVASGKTPILKCEQKSVDAIADAAINACSEAGISLGGQWEQVIVWDDDGIQCRAMMDHADLSVPYILDLKTSPLGMSHRANDDGL